MKQEENGDWIRLRGQATARLSPDFGRQVVQKAVQERHRRRQQPQKALLTLVVLVCIVNLSVWWKSHDEQQQRVTQWEQWQSFQQVMLTSL